METIVVHADGAEAFAVIAHPHPDFGGNMHNPVVSALHRGLIAAGCSTIRFDFAGSTQPHADLAEAEELGASAFGSLPLVRAGYSFGADTAMTGGERALIGEVLVAPPMAAFQDSEPTNPAANRVIIIAAHDQFRLPDEIRQLAAGWQHTDVVELASTDHFFGGTTHLVEEHTHRAVSRWLSGS